MYKWLLCFSIPFSREQKTFAVIVLATFAISLALFLRAARIASKPNVCLQIGSDAKRKALSVWRKKKGGPKGSARAGTETKQQQDENKN